MLVRSVCTTATTNSVGRHVNAKSTTDEDTSTLKNERPALMPLSAQCQLIARHLSCPTGSRLCGDSCARLLNTGASDADCDAEAGAAPAFTSSTGATEAHFLQTMDDNGGALELGDGKAPSCKQQLRA